MQELLDSIEISTNITGKGVLVVPIELAEHASSLMEIGMPYKTEDINRIKNGAIYQAKSMGWIGDEYPYLDDTEEDTATSTDTEVTDSGENSTDTTINNNSSTTPSNSNNSSEQNETKYTTVPNLVGLDYDTAKIKMSESKIESSAIKEEYIHTSDVNKDNTIAEQSLKAGSKVEEWESMRKLTIYKYNDSVILEMPIKVVKKNVSNKDELLSGQEIEVKYNDEKVCTDYIDNSHFSGNDLIYEYPTPWINVNPPINSIKVDIYIGADLVKTQNISIKNLEGEKISVSGPNVRIGLDEITINITE